jgi:hypothetical protein
LSEDIAVRIDLEISPGKHVTLSLNVDLADKLGAELKKAREVRNH